ncbi:YTP1-like protein [Fusarium heterosporum]|uniref:YTP1-like protein n=1 Tax=Fusarium heterosporum TaxID=42747 RepID=A0A8H5X113_FUSHE|nr:YTP1-like protein [Fusarium heterosporum]
MMITKDILCASGALFSVIFPVVSAHGGGESVGMDMTTGRDGNATQTPKDGDYPDTYFAHAQHTELIHTHIALMVFSWVFILPIAVMFSLANSRFTLPTQLVFLAFNSLGILLSVIYNSQTPDLYPDNVHHKIGWIVTWVVVAQVLVSAVGCISGALGSKREKLDTETHTLLPTSTQEANLYLRTNPSHDSPYRSSHESHRVAQLDSPLLHSDSASTLDGLESSLEGQRKEYTDLDRDFEKLSLSTHVPRGTLVRYASKVAASRVWKFLDIGRQVVNRVVLPLGFVTLATGVATFGRFFEGQEIFNGLAHWVKGGVFFWLGIFTLGRWTGSFGELGWAWNIRPNNNLQKWRPSAEFVESFLIFFYGATNIFMEHLSGWGGAWTAQDMEHISITVLFLGGGLSILQCGMLIESTRVRNLLNTTVQEVEPKHPYILEEADGTEPPDTYEFSLNPIPALVIMLLGLMMSSHTQHSMMSSMVHKQWGNLLLGASLARSLTYLLMFIKPPKSVFPSRPPTELLAAFGLISGGIIFMASSTDTVNGMVHYDLDAMFMYTVTMGLVGLLMAWVVIVLAVKGWAVQIEKRRISS